MFNSYRFALTGLAVAALTLGASRVAQAETVFHLWGGDGSQSSYVFTEDGITLTVTASAENGSGDPYGADPHQGSLGMGVKNNGGLLDGEGLFGDDSSIDSDGLTETLWLSFSESVTIDWAKFSGVGDWLGIYLGKDDANFSDGDDEFLGSVELQSNLTGLDIVDFSDENLVLTGKTFGITPGEGDSFRLKKLGVDIATIPTPSAAAAGVLLFGGLLLKRRRAAAAA